MRFATLLLLGSTACSSVTVEERAERAACEGGLASSPSLLQSGLEEGVLSAEGGQLIFTTETSVQRIDPCSGTMQTLAELDRIRATAVYDGHLYIRHTDIMGVFGWLSRVPIAGGELEALGDLGRVGGLVASPAGVYSLARDAVSEKDRMLVDVTTGTAMPLVSIDTADGVKVYSLVGASDRGVYLRADFDSGSPTGLERWPHEGEELLAVEGTPAVYAIAVVNDEMAVVREPDHYGQEIAFVPTIGGEGRVVVSADELPQGYGVTGVTATSDALCWTTYGSSPSCKRLASSETRAMDDTGLESTSLVLLDDVLYWIRARSARDRELMAAVP